jgi:hypothetical protein
MPVWDAGNQVAGQSARLGMTEGCSRILVRVDRRLDDLGHLNQVAGAYPLP